MEPEIVVGPTDTLNLRVSVAALVRLLVQDPTSGETLLVLERTATLHQQESRLDVAISARPLGGGLRLVDEASLQAAIGDFHYDSHRAQEQRDFRLCVRLEAWPQVQAFCLHHLGHAGGALEADPRRELVEEIYDALGIAVQPGDYDLQPESVVIEHRAAPTTNLSAAGLPTVRLYSVFSGRLVSSAIIEAVLASSASFTDDDLRCQALGDASRGGKGRANALLALPLDELVRYCSSLTHRWQDQTLCFAGHLLQSSILALLPEVDSGRYLRPPSSG